MPFLVRWPGKIQPGTRSEALIQNIDYGPTFLDIAGASIPEEMQGRSLKPLFENSGGKTSDWRDADLLRLLRECGGSCRPHS